MSKVNLKRVNQQMKENEALSEKNGGFNLVLYCMKIVYSSVKTTKSISSQNRRHRLIFVTILDQRSF